MTDIERALQAAEYAMYQARLGMVVGGINFGEPEMDGREDLIARAAVLAFLREMPNSVDRDGSVALWYPSRMIGAIEGEP